MQDFARKSRNGGDFEICEFYIKFISCKYLIILRKNVK